MLQLKIQKPGDPTPKLRLSMNKGDRFTVELEWDSPHDLDAHALLATNPGTGAKVDSFDKVLSTYNCAKTNSEGTLPGNPDGSFETPDGALHHSGDSKTGVDKAVDEVITVNGSKVAADVNEIPIFITIHHLARPATFGDVKHAGIRIKDAGGRVLGEYKLSDEFSAYDCVQMGSLIHGANGWEYAAVGVGFSGNFNMILENFS